LGVGVDDASKQIEARTTNTAGLSLVTAVDTAAGASKTALLASICFPFHWWKKGLPFDTYVSNQIRSATNGFISPGSFSGSISPGSKGTFSPGFI
jgi:hypothetical protein